MNICLYILYTFVVLRNLTFARVKHYQFFFSFDTDKQNMLSLLHYQYERIHVKLKEEKHYLLGDIFLNTVMGVFCCWGWVFGFFEPEKIMGNFLDYCPLVDSMYKQIRKVAIF